MATEENKPQQELEHEENQENPQDDDTEEEEEDDEDESPPSKLPKLSSDDYSGLVTTAIPSPLGLGLGLALGGGVVEEEATTATSSAAAAAEVKSPFTFMQMQEFHHQNLIYKHMVAGIDVPIHLILPIWKSVAASYGPHHYPSFVGLGSLCYDFRNSMEPEPGRCRRTDGKKWRCSRDVVPDQKYCERHMHRGRNRSRKTVEAAAAVATGAGTNLSIAVADSGSTAESTNSSSGSNHRIGLAPAAAPCNS